MSQILTIAITLFSLLTFASENPRHYQGHHAKQVHENITHDLYLGHITNLKPFSKNDNRNPLFKVEIFNPSSNRKQTAIFKPRNWGDGDGWNRVPMEYVAYELNLLLGMDYIPPVAYRRNLSFGDQFFYEGAMLYFVPNAVGLKDLPESRWGDSKKLFLSDARVIDVLLQNSDRHIDNFMGGTHWNGGQFRPILIDQAASLRHGAKVSMKDNNAFNTGATKVVRQTTWKRLQELNFDTLKNIIGEFVSDQEISFILGQRDYICSYFQSLIDKKGFKNVVLN